MTDEQPRILSVHNVLQHPQRRLHALRRADRALELRLVRLKLSGHCIERLLWLLCRHQPRAQGNDLDALGPQLVREHRDNRIDARLADDVSDVAGEADRADEADVREAGRQDDDLLGRAGPDEGQEGVHRVQGPDGVGGDGLREVLLQQLFLADVRCGGDREGLAVFVDAVDDEVVDAGNLFGDGGGGGGEGGVRGEVSRVDLYVCDVVGLKLGLDVCRGACEGDDRG